MITDKAPFLKICIYLFVSCRRVCRSTQHTINVSETRVDESAGALYASTTADGVEDVDLAGVDDGLQAF